MTSTSVEEYPPLFHQLLFLPVDVSVIVVTYLALIRLNVVSFFGIFDRLLPGWDPSPDQYTPSLRCMLRRCPKHSSRYHRWNRCQKRYNCQWARMRVYPFRLRHFQHQPPDIVPEDNLPKAAMPILIYVLCISAGVERWCHRQAGFLVRTPIAALIKKYFYYVRRRRDTPVFCAYAGTFREARERPHAIRFVTDSYQIGIDTFASR